MEEEGNVQGREEGKAEVWKGHRKVWRCRGEDKHG